MREMLKSKIHRARITDCQIDYEGSVTIDKELMETADILPYEQVQVLNINNGARFTTYVIEGKKGEIHLNGPATRLGIKGDLVIILSYCHVKDDELYNFKTNLVYVDNHNAVTKTKQGIENTTF